MMNASTPPIMMPCTTSDLMVLVRVGFQIRIAPNMSAPTTREPIT